MTRAERRTHWRTIIGNQATSGVSIAAYCRNIQIQQSYFYTWRRKLREQQRCSGGFLELISGGMAEATSGIRICVGEKFHIAVERGFDPLTLRTVVETLNGLSRCSV